MNKERNVIELNAIVVFDRNVRVSELNEFFQEFKGDIVINGDLILDQKVNIIQCDNLYVMGQITFIITGSQKDIQLEGNLYVEGPIDCYDIKVNGSVCCMNFINSYEINVSEDLYVKRDIESGGYDINVGGELICEDGVEAAEIIVLKKIDVRGRIVANSISVG